MTCTPASRDRSADTSTTPSYRQGSGHPNGFPVITGASSFLAHVPGLARHGSKPARELEHTPALLPEFLANLRDFETACAYPPHQVFIGNLAPEALWDVPRPWYHQPAPNGARNGPFGEIMPEDEFIGLLKICDDFKLVLLEARFVEQAGEALAGHRLIQSGDLERLGEGVPRERVEAAATEPGAVPLYVERDRLVGCVLRGHEEDAVLTGQVLLENLACKASGMLAMRHVLALDGAPGPARIEYVLGCGEEASGDRYQRGGGAMAKAMAEQAGCLSATGADLKAYCCSPIHAVALAGATIQSGLFDTLLVVGGGAMAKLGMKFRGHLRAGAPILEDVLAAIAITLGPPDGKNPALRLDAVGKYPVGARSTPQALAEHLVAQPLERIGRTILDVDKFSLELHDPDVTQTAGSGNVPRNNYRILGSVAVMRGEMTAADLPAFEREHGMPGFSPTQGHIAAAIPYLGHARARMLAGEIDSAMFVAKGSLFLGRMTQLSDGLSVLVERNYEGK